MAGALGVFPAKVTVLRKMAESRVIGLEDSITPEEVAAAVAVTEGCQNTEVSVGVIRTAHRGLGSVWLRCPLTAARKLGSSSDGGKRFRRQAPHRVISGEGHPHPALQHQCHTCLETGHMRRDCPSTVDRLDSCNRCSMEGHSVRDCLARVPKRPICVDLGLPASHRLSQRSPRWMKKQRRGQPA
jgi:hypothetical protein